jgi:hypothetical protein
MSRPAKERCQEPLTVDVSLPTALNDGAELDVLVRASCPAYLVVFALDQTGQGALLAPSDEDREPRVGPGTPSTVPTAAQRKRRVSTLRASLVDPRTPAYEMLVAYALRRRDDLTRLRPLLDELQQTTQGRVAALDEALQRLPAGTWARSAKSYVIVPRTE